MDVLNKEPNPTLPVKKGFFNKFEYKLLLILSILVGLIVLYMFAQTLQQLAHSYQHAALNVSDLSAALLALGLFLMQVALIAVTYSYIRSKTRATRLSNASAIVMEVIVILGFALHVFTVEAVILSQGVLALIPGGLPLVSVPVVLATVGLYFLSFICLICSFSRRNMSEKMKISFLWLPVLIIAVSLILPRIVPQGKAASFLSTPISISAAGSTEGWQSYQNAQVGVSFMYPQSWPTPSYYGIDGHGNPEITIQGNRQPMVMDIEIGQMVSDNRTCGECVPLSFNDAVSSFGSYLELTSPDYERKTIELKGKSYVLFTTDGDGGNAVVFIPNDVSPNNYAMVDYDLTDLNTLYLFLENFNFVGWKSPAIKEAPVFTFTSDDLAASGWAASTSDMGGFTFKYPNGWKAEYEDVNIYGFDSSQITISLGYNKTLFIVWGDAENGRRKTIEDELGGSQAQAIIDGVSYLATFSEPSNIASSLPQLSSIFVQKGQSDLDYVRISGQGVDMQTIIDLVSGFRFLN